MISELLVIVFIIILFQDVCYRNTYHFLMDAISILKFKNCNLFLLFRIQIVNHCIFKLTNSDFIFIFMLESCLLSLVWSIYCIQISGIYDKLPTLILFCYFTNWFVGIVIIYLLDGICILLIKVFIR